jgi:glycosyltransferase involved in cell wall biosynthesis
MRVSILNLNLVAKDASGTCILNQMRFFLRRGDDVRIYTAHPPKGVPADLVALTTVTTLKDLIGKREDHFRLSDLYIYHYPSRHPLMDSIKIIERGAVIFYYHNVTPPELWSSSVARDELARGVEGVSLVHYADLAVADSPFNREDLVLRGYDPERIHVLPLAVPLEQFNPGPKDPELVRQYGLEGQRVLLFVGRMASNKRIDLLVEALPLIKAEVPNVALMLVGDADSSEPYRDVSEQARRRADELGVAKDVIFSGVVENLDAYYRLADLYVTASLHEGFGVPLIEAMASGVPVVASRVASHPWVVSEAGLLCEPKDPADMARQVVQLLQDDKRYGELVQWGLERVRTFSIEAYDAGFAEIVDEATRWVQALPPVRQRGEGAPMSAGLDAPSGVRRGRMLIDDLTELYAESDVMLRPYVVRSKLPVFGPLIAWVRRNLTSHLRGPYLDPMMERQVSLNRQLIDAMERTRDYVAGQNEARRQDVAQIIERQTRLEKRAELLEAQMRLALARQLEGIETDLEELEAEITGLTVELEELQQQNKGSRSENEVE